MSCRPPFIPGYVAILHEANRLPVDVQGVVSDRGDSRAPKIRIRSGKKYSLRVPDSIEPTLAFVSIFAGTPKPTATRCLSTDLIAPACRFQSPCRMSDLIDQTASVRWRRRAIVPSSLVYFPRVGQERSEFSPSAKLRLATTPGADSKGDQAPTALESNLKDGRPGLPGKSLPSK